MAAPSSSGYCTIKSRVKSRTISFSDENMMFLQDYDVITREFPLKSGNPPDFIPERAFRYPIWNKQYLFCSKLHLNIDSTPLAPLTPPPLPHPPSPTLLATTPLPLSTTCSPNNLSPLPKVNRQLKIVNYFTCMHHFF